ncbi:MAG TPA: M20 family metallopeptidase [Microlunatus sp.]|nr:M20 family metallopeptidase [Microlunatus sp.]
MTTTFDDDLVALRRRLHQVPELGLQLPRTQSVVLEELSALDLDVTTGSSVSSVVAVLRGTAFDRSDRVVLLRGDMDALPVVENSGEPFSATGETMHACGHDLHTAGLVGAARLLHGRRSELRGDVVFMFQPGEEGWDGAGAMIAEGVLDAAGRRADAAYGLHVLANMLPRGLVTARPGPLMAASSGLYVTVRGAGGHGSRPHAAVDPIVVAAEMVTALQSMATRQFDVFDPVVVTVGTFHAGTRRNIIPETATFEATVRTLSEAHLVTMETAAVTLCEQIAAAHGCSAEVSFEREYPLTVNDAAKTAFALSVATELVGADRVRPLANPLMGSEDFSRVLAEVPGCYLFVGACPGDPETAPGNHAPGARFDDGVLGDCARLLAELAVRELAPG